MTLPLSQNSVANLYASVIDDVVSGVREFFMDEGVDEQVLLELKHMWELKLKTTEAIEVPKPDPDPALPPLKSQQSKSDVPDIILPQHMQSQMSSSNNVMASASSASNTVTSGASSVNSEVVPVEIAIPNLANPCELRYLTLRIPNNINIKKERLQPILSGPILSAAMALPHNLATSSLEHHFNAAFQADNPGVISVQNPQVVHNAQGIQSNISNGTNASQQEPNLMQQQYTHQGGGGMTQVDGARDSSDEDDNDNDNDNEDEDEDDDKDDDDKDEEDDDPDAAADDAIEEEPLNSGDDVSEDDPSEMFETDNVVVCQYDKITRSRNKWKLFLKDGIMNLRGKDFVFQKSSGDAEW